MLEIIALFIHSFTHLIYPFIDTIYYSYIRLFIIYFQIVSIHYYICIIFFKYLYILKTILQINSISKYKIYYKDIMYIYI